MCSFQGQGEMHGSGENALEHREEKGPDQDPDGNQNFVFYFVITYKPGGQKIENYKIWDFERIESL